MLGITPRTLYRLIDAGEIPAYRMGRVIRLQLGDGGALEGWSFPLGRPLSNPHGSHSERRSGQAVRWR